MHINDQTYRMHTRTLPPAPPQVLPSLPFRSLQELNLDRNFLVNFASLGALPALGVLRLSYNRIESVRIDQALSEIA